MNAGAITFSTALDNSQLDKQLNGLTKKISAIQNKITQKQAERMPLVTQSEQLVVQLDAAKARLYEMQSASKGVFSSEQIKEQQIHVNGLQTEWSGVQGRLEKYNADISKATIELDRNKEKAGAVAAELAAAGNNSSMMNNALGRASLSMDKILTRIRRLATRVLFFSVITMALRGVREWLGKIIKVSPEATAAIAKLKAALLTMAQPLVNVIIPAFTTLVNVLAEVITMIARVVSMIAGMTLEQAAKSAEALNKETEALDGTGAAAKKASKQLAAFDEINKLGDNSDSGGSGGNIKADFSSLKDNWLENVLGNAAEKVAAGLILGGLALIAIGAATGSLKAVIAGLLLIGSGVYVADATGVLPSWADALGLNNVGEFIWAATMLGGVALVAIGASMGNILAVVSGLGLIGAGVVYSDRSGQMKSWSDSLELDKAASYVTAGLLIGGMALVVFGIALANVLMIVAGLGLLASGMYIGTESGTLRSWIDTLMLPQVAGWVTAGLLLAGIGLIVFGIVMANILMLVGGLMLLVSGVGFGTQSGTLRRWWDVLCLPQVAGWVTASLLLGGIGLTVFGIVTANVLMLIAGLALLGVGVTFGITSGTFKKWWDTLMLPQVATWVTAALLLGGIALVAIGAATMNLPLVLLGLGLLGVGAAVGLSASSKGTLGTSASVPNVNLDNFHVPGLATGAVIPPNQEFLALLGDQKHGTNIEAPLETIVAAFRQVMRESGGGKATENILILDGEVIYRNQQKVARRHGMELA